jgi:hypothetical protein
MSRVWSGVLRKDDQFGRRAVVHAAGKLEREVKALKGRCLCEMETRRDIDEGGARS